MDTEQLPMAGGLPKTDTTHLRRSRKGSNMSHNPKHVLFSILTQYLVVPIQVRPASSLENGHRVRRLCDSFSDRYSEVSNLNLNSSEVNSSVSSPVFTAKLVFPVEPLPRYCYREQGTLPITSTYKLVEKNAKEEWRTQSPRNHGS